MYNVPVMEKIASLLAKIISHKAISKLKLGSVLLWHKEYCVSTCFLAGQFSYEIKFNWFCLESGSTTLLIGHLLQLFEASEISTNSIPGFQDISMSPIGQGGLQFGNLHRPSPYLLFRNLCWTRGKGGMWENTITVNNLLKYVDVY